MSLKVCIKKDFGDFKLDVDFAVEGGVNCLLGASGCGKSLTLKCIAGLVEPDSGYIELDGTVLYSSRDHINLPPQQRRVGYLFQNYALFPNMTVRQNLLCGLVECRDKAKKEEKIQEMLSFFELKGLEKHYPHQLSGGQAQRVALARIMLSQPRILLLDEPLSAMDAYLKDKLAPEMKRMLKAFPQGVLMVTHSRNEAYRLSDYATVMQAGHILPIRPIKKLFADPKTIEAALVTGCKNVVAIEKSGEYEVFVPDWQIYLKTADPVTDDITHIGIRAHYFNEDCPQNVNPITYVDEIEEPFEWIIQFRYANQQPDTPAIWWRLAKSERPKEFPKAFGIAPANIMLLGDGAIATRS